MQLAACRFRRAVDCLRSADEYDASGPRSDVGKAKTGVMVQVVKPAHDATALFQVISRRCQRPSTVLTTNRSLASWGDIFSDTTIAASHAGPPTRPKRRSRHQRRQLPQRAWQAQARKHRPKGNQTLTHQHTRGGESH